MDWHWRWSCKFWYEFTGSSVAKHSSLMCSVQQMSVLVLGKRYNPLCHLIHVTLQGQKLKADSLSSRAGGAQLFSSPQEKKETFQPRAVQVPVVKQQTKGSWGSCRLSGEQEKGGKWGWMSLWFLETSPELKKRGGKKGAGGCRSMVFFRLCLSRANFWLLGKLGLCWADQLAAKQNDSHPLPLFNSPSLGRQ